MTKKNLIPNKIMDYEAVKEFMEHKNKAGKICRSYKSGINMFFEFLKTRDSKINPDNYIPMRTIKYKVDGKTEILKTRSYADAEKDTKIFITKKYQKDIEAWKDELIKIISVKSVNSYLTTLRVFFTYYCILEDAKFWKEIRITRTENKENGEKLYKYNKTSEQPITHEFIQGMLGVCGSVKNKAIILCLASSGLRVGELFKLKLEHIELNKNPVQINVPSWIAKNDAARTTFISKEATKHVKKWLEKDKDGKSLRDKYLKSAVKKIMHKNYEIVEDPKTGAEIKVWDGTIGLKTTHGLITKDANDDTLFPLGDDAFHKIWIQLLKKTGNDIRDENTQVRYHVYRIHGLRRWFRRNMAKCDDPRAEYLSEQLLGHASAHYLPQYSDESKEALALFYMKAEKHITVFEPTALETQKQFEELQQRQIELEERMRKMIDEKLKDIETGKYKPNWKEVNPKKKGQE